MEEKKEKAEKKNQTAEEIAKIMVENMKANMNDPDFFIKKERIRQEIAHRVIKERLEREEDEEQN